MPAYSEWLSSVPIYPRPPYIFFFIYNLLIFTYIIFYYNSNIMNIYDCFMYFDEDLLLDLRLNILNPYVKKFVITESTYLHSGKKKDLKFDYKNFSKFKDKIIYIVVDTPPLGIEEVSLKDSQQIKNKKILDNSLKRENNQRNQLKKGLAQADDNDLILSSDLDEIPNLENFKSK